MSVPSNWEKVKKIRQSKNASLKDCKYLKPGTNLRYYQVIGVLNTLLSKRMILGDGAGLGKTLQMIASFAVLKEKQPQWKLLIVAQKSSISQWGEEFKKFTQGLTWHVLKPKYKPEGSTRQVSGFKARKAQYEDFAHVDALIVGYHALKEDYKFLIENRTEGGSPFMVVFDECQEFKNHKTQSFNGADELKDAADRIYGLTATPIKNRLVEFFYILKIVVPGLFPGVTKFRDTYCKQQLSFIPMRGGGSRRVMQVVGYKNLMGFKNIIEPYFLIRRTADVSDELPKLVSRRINIEMSNDQKKLYAEALSGIVYRKKIKEKYFNFLEEYNSLADPTEKQTEKLEELQERYDLSMSEDGRANAKTAALVYCQLIANGPEWVDERGKSEKELEFKRLVEDELSGQSIIVFTRFATGVQRLQNICEEVGIKSVRITGSDDQDARDSARLAFQDKEGDTKVIFITYAGSAGLNLQRAGVLIFYDTPWSFGDLYQIIGRAQRLGSEHSHVLVMHMVTEGTIDEHVLQILEGKKKLNDQVLGDIAEGSLEFGTDEVAIEGEEGEVDALYKSVFG